MLRPSMPHNESERLETLRSLHILDTPPEERFDRLTRLARRLFGVPIAAVTLVDSHRQWFKSHPGIDASETPRDVSFCSHAILDDELFLVNDALLDVRFADNPLVTGDPNIRFYAGYPLTVDNGSRLGTLCLIDVKPRALDDEERVLLRDLARMAEQEISAVQLATTDELTGLSNRRGFEALAQHAIRLCKRAQKPASLLFFDLNGFKNINDVHGHAEGDRALIAFATVLQTALRDSDVIGRLGGDEFVVLLSDSDEEGTAQTIARLRHQLDVHNQSAQAPYQLHCSVGTATYAPDSSQSIDDLLAQADGAMYANKRSQR
ncbi:MULTISPECIES: sensor domain-containing diguanylate cyclase [Paraburkholderia]|uniref:Diguanylate cyclase n=1 Tax=Paraburkholderia caribensis TaxID=75105 RepID=A0A9Q6S285_9BURK|nr:MULTISPECIES: sensor domain-containing diguanylate cyclase [Paraburkholderia]QLB63203.1 diguanylate cyclase [Paraburkholderia caribensis]CAG9216021.1 Diguanylate cyclase [Paraburkholderia caribensis]